ncbi:hypothetical protein BD779DRAFT_106488 [Infundibulicybe gibba]|nr:hypothetical protein BD779DRAFT_106488 [Infundibulicybe gibba]
MPLLLFFCGGVSSVKNRCQHRGELVILQYMRLFGFSPRPISLKKLSDGRALSSVFDFHVLRRFPVVRPDVNHQTAAPCYPFVEFCANVCSPSCVSSPLAVKLYKSFSPTTRLGRYLSNALRFEPALRIIALAYRFHVSRRFLLFTLMSVSTGAPCHPLVAPCVNVSGRFPHRLPLYEASLVPELTKLVSSHGPSMRPGLLRTVPLAIFRAAGPIE